MRSIEVKEAKKSWNGDPLYLVRSNKLRFIERDGSRILQQEWIVDMPPSSQVVNYSEWFDVPIEVGT